MWPICNTCFSCFDIVDLLTRLSTDALILSISNKISNKRLLPGEWFVQNESVIKKNDLEKLAHHLNVSHESYNEMLIPSSFALAILLLHWSYYCRKISPKSFSSSCNYRLSVLVIGVVFFTHRCLWARLPNGQTPIGQIFCIDMFYVNVQILQLRGFTIERALN